MKLSKAEIKKIRLSHVNGKLNGGLYKKVFKVRSLFRGGLA
jgi:hypothetical protein